MLCYTFLQITTMNVLLIPTFTKFFFLSHTHTHCHKYAKSALICVREMTYWRWLPHHVVVPSMLTATTVQRTTVPVSREVSLISHQHAHTHRHPHSPRTDATRWPSAHCTPRPRLAREKTSPATLRTFYCAAQLFPPPNPYPYPKIARTFDSLHRCSEKHRVVRC